MNVVRKFALAVALAAALLGCQSSGQVQSEERSPDCPTCKSQTVTTSLAGVSVEKHICPNCGYTDVFEDSGQPHHYCETCLQVVQECEQCSAQPTSHD